MNEEIAESLREISTPTGLSYSGDRTLNNSYTEKIIDYITNLRQKVEQLENIRKEAIEYIENNTKYYDADYSETYRELCSMPGANDTRLHVIVGDIELLNILNKGE